MAGKESERDDAVSETITKPTIMARPRATTLASLYHVILLNDDEHTFEYVIDMLCKLFGHSTQMAHQMALEVHRTGRVIVATLHKEAAELRQEQIQNHGADRLVASCKGSMKAAIEPACSISGRN